jgi:potassium/hydrogen antiporter
MVGEIAMFFALGLLVFPSQFGPIAVKAVLLALITALIARPLAATAATVGQRFTWPERAVIDGVPRGVELLNIVFFAVLVSAGLQGATVHSLASRVVPARPPKMRPGTHSGRAARRRSWSYKPKEEHS